MSDSHEIAWAAGFYDGEGHANYKAPSNSVHLSIDQVELSPLVRFRDAVGVGSLYGPYASNGGKSSYRYATTNLVDFQVAVDALWPFLCEPKKNQILRQVQRRWDVLSQRGIDGKAAWYPGACLRDP